MWDRNSIPATSFPPVSGFHHTNVHVGPEGEEGEIEDLRLQVQERMDIKERAHDFRFTFGDDGDDDQVCRSPQSLHAL